MRGRRERMGGWKWKCRMCCAVCDPGVLGPPLTFDLCVKSTDLVSFFLSFEPDNANSACTSDTHLIRHHTKPHYSTPAPNQKIRKGEHLSTYTQ